MRARSAGSSGYSTAERRFSRPSSSNSRLLLLAKDVAAGRGEGQGVLGIDAELHAVVLGAEVVGAVRADAAAAVGDRRAQHDELRQVVVERAQAVVDPRADRGELPFEHVPAGVELQLGAVVVVGGPHRADDGEVVDAAAEVRPPVADLQPALPALLEADLQGIELVANVAVGVVRHDDPQVLADELGESSTSLCGVSPIFLPAYLLSAGLGSKLSRWLMPPTRKIQMTFLALGRRWGRPSGGAQPRSRRPGTMPSRAALRPAPGR